LADITINSAAIHTILSRLDSIQTSMAPISKKRAAIELQSYHSLVNGLNNMNGYSSDSSNQGTTSSETSNSSSNNMNLNNLTNNALGLTDSIPLSALQSLNALGLGHPSHLSALHTLNQTQLITNLSSLTGLSSALNASSSTNNSSASSSNSLDTNQLGKQYAKVNRVVLDKNSEEYRRRRERNNLAVKKSRTKSKIKTMQTMERVKILKAENEDLQQKIETLTKELSFLKNLFIMHASQVHNTDISEFDLSALANYEILQHESVPLNLNSKFNGLINHQL